VTTLPEDDFVNHFAADVDPVLARVMYAVQQPASGARVGLVARRSPRLCAVAVAPALVTALAAGRRGAGQGEGLG
jgi:hypothetical protein